MKHLELLFNNLQQANLTVNFKKSQFFRKEINYLGFRLSTQGISATEDKIAAIMNFPRPRNHKQLKAFLGLTNFYNRFSNKYAASTQPLLQLLRKGSKFKWTDALEEQFNRIKNLFTKTVMLHHPDPNKRYYVQTDASQFALGGQLFQFDDDGNIAVIAFTSMTFKGAELNY